MQIRRASPEGITEAEPEALRLEVFPFIVFAYVLINGLFNFTPRVEAFYVTIIFMALAGVYMVFNAKSRSDSGLSDPLSWSALLWCLLVCMSVLWAVSASDAMHSWMSYAGSFFLFFTTRSYCRLHPSGSKERVTLARAVGCAGGLISLLSIEMASTGLLRSLYFGALAPIFKLNEYSDQYGFWVEGARMQSLLGLPNLYATFAAACFFILLWTITSSGKKATGLELAALTANGAGFFLAGSRGGVIAFLLACLVYILFTKKGNRKLAFLEGFVLTIWSGAAALIAMRWMGTESLAIWVALAILLYLPSLWWRFVYKWLERLSGGRVFKPVIITAVALAAIYIVIALLVRTPFPLYDPQARLYRAASLPTGECELNIEADYFSDESELDIVIESMSREKAALMISDILVEKQPIARGESINFTVPDDSVVVSFTVTASGGPVSLVSMTAVSENLKSYKIPMEYNLIPEGFVSRLQGFWADPNSFQRTVFWRDGLKLFSQSPLFGLGGGAFQTMSGSVAEYDYFTKHVHNYYIQVLVENGIAGLLLALITLILAVVYLIRTKMDGPERAGIAGVLAMIMIHSVTEASLHNHLNVNLLFIILGIISATAAQNIPQKKASKASELSKAAAVLLAVIVIALLTGSIITPIFVQNAEKRGAEAAFDAYRWAVITDPLNASSYKSASLSWYISFPDTGAEGMNSRFAGDLESNQNDPQDCFIVGRYYLRINEPEKAVRFLERTVELKRVDPLIWDEVLAQYMRALRGADENETRILYESLLRLEGFLREINDSAPIPVEPNPGLLIVFDKALNA